MQEIRFTESVVRRAAIRGVLRSFGPVFFVAVLLLSISVMLGLIRGDRSWFIGSTLTILGLALAVPIAAIAMHTRVGLAKFRRLENGNAALELSSGRLRVASNVGTLEMPVAQITRVWRYPEFWILLSGKSILMTVPLAGIPAGVLSSWQEELRTAGARVA